MSAKRTRDEAIEEHGDSSRRLASAHLRVRQRIRRADDQASRPAATATAPALVRLGAMFLARSSGRPARVLYVAPPTGMKTRTTPKQPRHRSYSGRRVSGGCASTRHDPARARVFRASFRPPTLALARHETVLPSAKP